MKASQAKVNARLVEIEAHRQWLYDNLEGCDWCCGGGDNDLERLAEEEAELLSTTGGEE